jgi:ABC-type iron transport system FetAB permease component
MAGPRFLCIAYPAAWASRIREALRSGFMPIMNSIAAIGLVSLPG